MTQKPNQPKERLPHSTEKNKITKNSEENSKRKVANLMAKP